MEGTSRLETFFKFQFVKVYFFFRFFFFKSFFISLKISLTSSFTYLILLLYLVYFSRNNLFTYTFYTLLIFAELSRSSSIHFFFHFPRPHFEILIAINPLAPPGLHTLEKSLCVRLLLLLPF